MIAKFDHSENNVCSGNFNNYQMTMTIEFGHLCSDPTAITQQETYTQPYKGNCSGEKKNLSNKQILNTSYFQSCKNHYP